MNARPLDAPYSRAGQAVRVRPAIRWLPTVRRSLPAGLAVAGGIIGFGWMAMLLLSRANGLATPAYDHAFFEQVVWNASQGNGFVSNFSQGSFLGLHFSPLLVLPAALEQVWADARVLSLLHVAALALAGPAAFLFLRAALSPSRAGPWLAAALAAPLPVWSAVQEAARADFHTESLALPLALLAGWAGLRGRTALLWILAGVALLAKEDQGYTLLVLGLFLAARARGRLWRGGLPWRGGHPVAGPRLSGAAIALLGLAWTPLAFGVIMPWLRAGGRLETDWYYAWLLAGDGPASQLGRIWSQLAGFAGWQAALGILLSVALLPVLRPRWLLLVIPPIVADLLSANSAQADLKLHYTLLPLLPAIVAAAMGGRRLLALMARRTRRSRSSARHPAWGPPLLLTLALPALAVAWLGGGLPPTTRTDRGQWDWPAAIDELRAVARQVPPGVPLAVDDGLAAPLAARSQLRLLPTGEADAWVLVDRHAYLPGYTDVDRRRAFISILPRSGRPLIIDDGRFQLWGPQR